MAKIIFEEARHIYWKEEDDGTRVKIPSVTRIIGVLEKPALMYWAAEVVARFLIGLIPDIKAGKLVLTPEDAKDLFWKAKKEPERLKEEAGNVGTLTHEAVEHYLKTGGKPKGLSPEVQKTFNAFLSFSKQLKLGKIIATEKILFSSSYEYAGRLDIFAWLGSKKYIIDIKTGKDFYKEQPLQLSAYSNAYEEMTGEKVDGIGIIRLSKEDGLSYWKDFTAEREISFRKFLCLLDFISLK